MVLKRLGVRGWRSFVEAGFEPGPRASVLFGRNGQGKTNLIEAAFVALTFRSFRTNSAEEMVRWGSEAAAVEAEVTAGGLDRRLEVKLAAAVRKETLLDGKPVRRDAAGLQGIAAVLFVPEDLLLPRSAPAQRRQFLDRAIFGADRTYMREAAAYERVLRSRNAVLRQERPDRTLLEAFDEELASAGARVVGRRRRAVAALGPRFESLFVSIHSGVGARIRYRSHPLVEAAAAEAEVRAALIDGLRGCRERDLRRGFSGFGPHTDDLEMDLAGHRAGDHGSQGQLRSLVLALKLAELAHLHEASGEAPLLLLDDVASELDEVRRGRLFETIAGLPGQTVITVTDRDLLPHLPERRDFEVADGSLRPV